MKRHSTEQKRGKENKGSALLIAIVIMMVTMMLSLALLLVSFSLYSTASRQNNAEQCKEAAQSFSKAIEAEITITPFNTYAEQASKENDNPLWFYLRYNVWQSSWPYYDETESEAGHTAAYAFRYFKMNDELEGIDDMSVLMYWISENEAVKEDVSLVVQVTCRKGKQKSVIESKYNLTVEAYPEVTPGEDEEDNKDIDKGNLQPRSSYNPNNNWIYESEKWSWEPDTGQ